MRVRGPSGEGRQGALFAAMQRLAWVPVLGLSMCSKAPPADERRPTEIAAPQGSGASAPRVMPSAAGPSPPTTTSLRWEGSYQSEAGTLYIPPDWKGVRWNPPASSAGIGEGAVSIAIDRANGRVAGTVAGPLGPAVLRGFSDDGGVFATIGRQDPTDQGFAGTLQGEISGDALTGTMHLAPADGTAVREAKFSLKRSAASP